MKGNATMKIKKYSAYKDSGIEWIGDIPEHWGKGRISAIFEERNVKVSDKEYAPLSVTKLGVVPQLDTAAKSKDSDNRKLVCKGDFVINSRSDRKGSSGVSQLEGSVSLINTVLEPKKIKHMYAGHLLKSYGFIEEFYRNGRGIVADLWSTNYNRMRLIQLPLPPLSEQKKIASFLEKKTAEIDKAIELKQKENGLLKEHRQITINQAVTRGLNPDVPLKDSGIEWIGDIPEHWEVRKNKFIFKERNLIVGNKSQDYTLLSLTLEGIKKRNLNVLQGKFPASFNTYKEVHSGDLVFCLFDMDETPRTIGLSKIKGMITGAYTIIIPRSNVTSHYYYYYYLNIDYEKKLKPLYRGLRKSVSIGAFMDYKLPLPPLSEQKKIAAYLEEVDKETNRLIELNHRAIDKLKEYKQVLIDQAVRGEICLV